MLKFFSVILLAALCACQKPSTADYTEVHADQQVLQKKHDGMIWIPGGEFTMGCLEESCPEGTIAPHRVRVDGFWMDETEVTNGQFRKFVEATKYITVAERPISWEELSKLLPSGTPKPPDEDLRPGALVFTPPTGTVLLNDYSQWWSWVVGADWKHPLGTESSIEGMDNYPVVQVAYEDALAYAQWADKRLPTEAQYEFAARGGLDGKKFSWGDELNPEGKYLANYFQGSFPNKNTAEDGFEGLAPVKSFPPNKFGLYDITGNIWELCSDWYALEAQAADIAANVVINPTGPSSSYDPYEPNVQKHVSKGGSFICSIQYCSNYKPSGRQGAAFDTGMNHTGFRCIKE